MKLEIDSFVLANMLSEDVNADTEYNVIEKTVEFLEEIDNTLSYQGIVDMLCNEVEYMTWDFFKTTYYTVDQEPTREDMLDMLNENTSVIWNDDDEVIFLTF